MRLPNHEKNIALEKEYMPDFKNILEQISEQFDIPYLTMAENSSAFEYCDGVHLCIESSVEVSKIITNFITKNQ